MSAGNVIFSYIKACQSKRLIFSEDTLQGDLKYMNRCHKTP